MSDASPSLRRWSATGEGGIAAPRLTAAGFCPRRHLPPGILPAQSNASSTTPPTITTTHYLASHFPALRRSLSLALRTFYYLAGAVVPFPAADTGLVISYSNGDSVPFLLDEADPSYFSALVYDDAKGVVLMKPFVPPPQPMSWESIVSSPRRSPSSPATASPSECPYTT